MFRQTCTAGLVALTALGSFTIAIAIAGCGEHPSESKPENRSEDVGGGGDKEVTDPSGSKQITNSIGMKLTLIPAGEFMMGSSESAEETTAFFKKNYGMGWRDAKVFASEYPQHRVRITKPFYLGTYHVTRGQFRQFVKDSGYTTDAAKGDAEGWDVDKKEVSNNWKYSWQNAGFEQTDEHPVVNVTWNDAVAFCEWLSKKEGKTYRLPTEAEWEYACRAGTTTRYFSGNDPETLAKVANVCDATWKATLRDLHHRIEASDGYVFTAPVGKFKPNAFGLCDMHGNASQWCADWYGRGYYGRSPVDDPKGPDTSDADIIGGPVRVLRGSSWFDNPSVAPSANRSFAGPHSRNTETGFRVARTQ